jgi:hypothetical protein
MDIERFTQQEKWRLAKQRYRAKKKLQESLPPPPVVENLEERRHPLSKLTKKEEGCMFLEFLSGDSQEVLGKRYGVSNRTVEKIMSYYKKCCEDRFIFKPIKEVEDDFIFSGF